MKRFAIDHWKMAALGRLLKIPVRYAITCANGIAERLWHATASYAPRGDIGKLPDEAIARACGWPELEAAVLVRALLDARLLDVDDKCRLVIHDWPEHCEDSVHSKLARSREYFAVGVAPKLTGLRKTEIETIRTYYRLNPYATTSQPVAPTSPTSSQSIALPCLSPALALPCLSQTTQDDWRHAEIFHDAWERHNKHRRDQPLQVVAQLLIGRDGTVNWEIITQVHPLYCRYWDEHGWQFCSLTFLEWIDAGMPPPPPEPVRGDTKGTRQDAIDRDWESLSE